MVYWQMYSTYPINPWGVIQDMLLNLFRLPNFCVNNEEMQSDAVKFLAMNFNF